MELEQVNDKFNIYVSYVSNLLNYHYCIFSHRVPQGKQNVVDLINKGQFGCVIAGEEGTISKKL